MPSIILKSTNMFYRCIICNETIDVVNTILDAKYLESLALLTSQKPNGSS